MYSRESQEPWETPALTGYSYEDFPSKTTQTCLLLRNDKIDQYLTWNSIRLNFVKNTSMPNPVQSLGYIKWCSSSRPSPVKRPSNSIRYNWQKISSWSRRLETKLEIRKKGHISIGDQQSCYLQVFQSLY